MELELFDFVHISQLLLLLHYSYMELERIGKATAKHFHEKITLFLYGIGAFIQLAIRSGQYRLHYSYMELEHYYNNQHLPYYIELHYSYMELEPFNSGRVSTSFTYYIIPIWNWSIVFFFY